MRNPFHIGDEKRYRFRVTEQDFACFPDEGLIHPVLSTFALTQCAEWASRLFVLEMIEPGEQGIGSSVEVRHYAPAVEGTKITITAVLTAVNDRQVQCSWQATDGARLLAEGTTEQHIISLDRFEEKLEELRGQLTDQS